ncbi:MAG: LysM domain-containing protein [Rhizomicrobium sp.]
MNGAGYSAPPDPVQAMLAQASLKNTLFASTSRYYGIGVETIAQDGRLLAYLKRRFLPQASNFQLLQEHAVVQGERLDNIAAQYLGDPTLFWRLADANNAMRPGELTETVGAKIRITMPENVSGTAL